MNQKLEKIHWMVLKLLKGMLHTPHRLDASRRTFDESDNSKDLYVLSSVFNGTEELAGTPAVTRT